MKKPLNLPKLLKTWRERMKFTQAQAAAHLGAEPRTYEAWEAGRQTPRGMGLSALLERIQ